METVIEASNPVLYYRIESFHEEFLGFDRPCNIWELMYLIGSEKSYDNFQSVNIDKKYLSYFKLKRFGIKRAKITPCMAESYPWYKLALSISENGIKTPLIVEVTGNPGRLKVIEGKHRIGAISLIVPYNPNYLIPSIPIVFDLAYTKKMWKQKHPDPAREEGFRKFGGR